LSDGAGEPDDVTVFSRAGFCSIWAEAHGLRWRPLPGLARIGVTYRRSRRLGLCAYELAPRGLYWGSLGGEAAVTTPLFAGLRRLSRRWSTSRIVLSCRHDARWQLERARAELGPDRCRVSDSTTRVLPLQGRSFEEVHAGFRKTARQELKVAERAGILVRRLTAADDLSALAPLQRSWAAAKGLEPPPPSLLPRLLGELPQATLLYGAYDRDGLVACIFLFRDPGEWFYWLGARDRQRDSSSAMYALLAQAIREACEKGVRTFNMGASNEIRSVEFFKERFGSERRPVWSLCWTSPLWAPLAATRRVLAATSGR
jgi:hypothetical protein